MARIRTPLLRPGMKLKDLHADEFNEAFSAGQHFASMRVGEGLAFKFSPVGGAMLTLTRRDPPRPRAGIAVVALTLLGVFPDWLVCGNEDGTGRVEAAKPFLLRQAPFDGQRRGDIAYSYTGIDARTASRGSAVEEQIIVPQYRIGDQIIALRGLDTGARNTPAITLLDLNVDAREWARKAPDTA